MKILHVTPYFKPAFVYGGPIASIDRLTRELVSAGCAVTVFTTNANGKEKLNVGVEISSGVSVQYFNHWGIGFFAPSLALAIWKNAQKYDVVHVHTWWNLTAILSVLICRIRKVKVVFSPRGMLSAYSFQNRKVGLKGIFQRILGNNLLKNTLIHATAEAEALECQRLMPTARCFVAPNFLDFPDVKALGFLKNEKHSDTTFRLIFLSRIHPKKGLTELFDALAQLKKPWHLDLVGKGDDDYLNFLKNKADALGLTPSVSWHDWADFDTKFALLANADVMILPSHNENFANVVIESLAVGTPVLVSPQVGLYEYVEKNDFGWVVPLETLAAGITTAANEIEKRAAIRAQAPAQIAADFSPQMVVNQYLRAYRGGEF